MDAKTDFGWSLSSFGHGMFQQIVMKPIIHQERGCIAGTCSSLLLADQTVIVGVLLCKPQGYKGSNLDFSQYIEKAIHHIEFGFSVLHDGSDVLHETFYMSAMHQSNPTVPDKALRVTEAGVAVTFHTTLNIAKQYLNIPLQILVTMNLIQTQGKPFNQRLVMDQTEMNVRLLMDLNRYRPQKIPERSLAIPVRIVHPLQVTTCVREVSADLSVLSIAVRNVHDKAHITINSLAFHSDRMAQVSLTKDNEYSIDQKVMSTLFNVSLLNPARDATDDHSSSEYEVVVPPQEEYIFLYSVTLHGRNSPAVHTHDACFSTPVTLYWSIAATDTDTPISNTNNSTSTTIGVRRDTVQEEIRSIVRDITTNSKHITHLSEYDCVASWTLGSQATTTSSAYSSTSTTNNNASNATTSIISNTASTNTATAGNNGSTHYKPSGLEITLRGPDVAHAMEPFQLRVCVTNRSARRVEIPVLHARSRICGSTHSLGQYIAHEPVTSFRDIEPGASASSVLSVTPLSVGNLCIGDIFVTEESKGLRQSVYQMQFPYQVLVKKRLETIDL